MLTGILHCQYSWLEPGSTSPAPSVNDNRIGPQLPGATHATYSGEVETERTSQQKAISRIHSEKLLTLTAWARRSDGELAQTWHQNASHQNNKASPVQSSNKHFLRTKRQEKEGKKKKKTSFASFAVFASQKWRLTSKQKHHLSPIGHQVDCSEASETAYCQPFGKEAAQQQLYVWNVPSSRGNWAQWTDTEVDPKRNLSSSIY